MKLGSLLANVVGAVNPLGPDVDIRDVRDDSRLVQPGDLFVAVSGTAADGRGFVSDARARGAVAIVAEPAFATGGAAAGVVDGALIAVPNARHALATMAANRFPTGRALTLTAVTGTNGKTTMTYLLEAMLAAAGLRAGVVGTIAYRLAGPRGASDTPAIARPAPLTTPGPLALHALFADLRAAGATDVVLEASSIALEQSRLDGCRFRVAGLTNLTQDHLDYHGTMERYLEAKAILFERLLDPTAGVAVLPVDRPEGRALRGRVNGRPVVGVAMARGTAGADVVVESSALSPAGIRAEFATPLGAIEIVSPLVGDYNLANLALAIGMGVARGLSREAIVAGVGRLAGVPGRLERVANPRGVLCLVDYAHTPDALERAIAAARTLVAPDGRLLTVFGCGGDRDRGKRPLMGEVAARGSDLAIITSDNPRSEDPAAIVDSIVEGVRRASAHELDEGDLDAATRARPGYHVVLDRRVAIRRAARVARPGDVLLIAGKGHEDYQIIGGQRLHFDDREEASSAFSALDAAERTPLAAPTSHAKTRE
jgi:UDP-N-acetylmuramoyl-L-alanyl-D-glutamate--2,6-diaminopimelate ligase